MNALRMVIITGLSGSGKSTAIKALEDMGYICIDNLPIGLLPKFVELIEHSQHHSKQVALVMDARGPDFLEGAHEALLQLKQGVEDLNVLFLEAEVEILVRRYSETRRRHPMAPRGSVRDGINQEKTLISPLRHLADHLIDTSQLTVHDLKQRLKQLFDPESKKSPTLTVNLLSFGFKAGLPIEADLVFDVRFLSNPFFIEELRPFTGLNPKVSNYVLSQGACRIFLTHLYNFLDFLLPQFNAEGKTYLTIAIGCTGGKHRSVAIIQAVGKRLSSSAFTVNVSHRDAVND